jgi:molecular chaperone DnaK
MGKCIGIDLGTTNSAVSVCEGGVPRIIVNSEGDRTTPSIVGFTKDGERKVGNPAKRQAIVNPDLTIHSVKRFIGCTFKDVEQYIDKFSYTIKSNDNGLPIIEIDGKDYTPQEISAAVLQKMKTTAEQYLGEEVTDAVITVPAYFNDAQRVATKEAAIIAGLNPKRIINEPTAAALAFGIDKLNKDMRILVFDAGGGTTDLSVLELGGGVFEVLSTNGDTFLGGNDIDNKIIDFLVEEGKKRFDVDLSKDPIALQRLKEEAEKAKIELSSTTSTEISLPYITNTEAGPQHLTCTLTRAMLERMLDDYIKKCIKLCEGVLEKAELKTSDIDEILLVGGTTRIPAIQNMIKDFFGKEGNKTVNPDEAVALGAAIQGSILAGEQTGIVLLDVTPLNLNITTMGKVATVMIPANTTIPTDKTEIFSTAVDNQPSVDIQVTQGNRQFAADNKRLGEFILDGIMPAMRGVPQIEVKFSLDANGILEVTATDKATGKKQDIRIEGSSGLSKEDVDRMKSEADAHADEDRKRMERVSKLNAAEQIIYQTEKNLKEYDDKLSEDQKKQLNDGLASLKLVYDVQDKDRDLSAITAAAEELGKIWYSIAATLYKDSSNGGMDTGFNPFGNTGFDFAPGTMGK